MSEKDYSSAAEWAERDMTLPEHSQSALRGDVAAAFGRDLVERSRTDRPSSGPDTGHADSSH